MTFAVMLAIGLATALNFGTHWLIIGIFVLFFGEYIYFCTYDCNTAVEEYKKNFSLSRNWLKMHTALCVFTLLFAAVFGVLSGFDYSEEFIGKNGFEYKTVHDDGSLWLYLILVLLIRFALQIIIEKNIKENIELSERRRLYNK